MSEPEDELTPLPGEPEDRSAVSRSPYVALGVAALVVSTVFATVAALAGTRDEAAPAPRSDGAVGTTASATYTTDPATTSSAPRSSKANTSSSSVATTTTTTTTTTEDTTTVGRTTTPGRTTTHRPPVTTTTTTKPNQAPTAGFTVGCTDLACDFDGGSSSDPDGSISSYSWSFGASGVTASHTFDSAGTYEVTLTVTDNKGKTDTATKSVTVTAPTATSGN